MRPARLPLVGYFSCPRPIVTRSGANCYLASDAESRTTAKTISKHRKNFLKACLLFRLALRRRRLLENEATVQKRYSANALRLPALFPVIQKRPGDFSPGVFYFNRLLKRRAGEGFPSPADTLYKLQTFLKAIHCAGRHKSQRRRLPVQKEE